MCFFFLLLSFFFSHLSVFLLRILLAYAVRLSAKHSSTCSHLSVIFFLTYPVSFSSVLSCWHAFVLSSYLFIFPFSPSAPLSPPFSFPPSSLVADPCHLLPFFLPFPSLPLLPFSRFLLFHPSFPRFLSTPPCSFLFHSLPPLPSPRFPLLFLSLPPFPYPLPLPLLFPPPSALLRR